MEYVSKPKSVICQEIGVDVLIDDCLDHALDCSSLGIDILLYDLKGNYQWNHKKEEKNHIKKRTLISTSKLLYQKEELTHNIKRVYNWKDIISQFPKPTSPLKHCYYPTVEEQQYYEEEEDEENTSIEDDLFDNPTNYYTYETIEVEELSDDDEDSNDLLLKENRIWV